MTTFLLSDDYTSKQLVPPKHCSELLNERKYFLGVTELKPCMIWTCLMSIKQRVYTKLLKLILLLTI